MAVKYRLRKRPTNLSKDIEDGFYPQVIRSDNVDSKGLASYVTGDHGFRSAAMLGSSVCWKTATACRSADWGRLL